jgi:D-amino-acid dehydrogenase
LAVFDSLHERDSYAKGLQDLRTLGLRTDFDVVDAGTAATLNPVVGPAVAGGVVLHDQRFVDPPVFMSALAENVTARGGRVRCGVDVRAIRRAGEAVELLVAGDPPRLERFDAVVVAAGAWLTPLLRGHGVRVRIRAGRGYSFRARTDVEVTDPLYLLGVHVAVTPMRGRLRLAGTMEFARPEDPLDERRIRAIVEKARPLLRDVDLDDREDEWVGPRPVSSDGMPLAGPSSTPGVWCIGGHAMEGMLLGPVTARLLAESVASRTVSGLLRPFDPCR